MPRAGGTGESSAEPVWLGPRDDGFLSHCPMVERQRSHSTRPTDTPWWISVPTPENLYGISVSPKNIRGLDHLLGVLLLFSILLLFLLSIRNSGFC